MSKPQRSGWWPALLALPILCCLGSSLLAAIGVGSVTAAVGGVTGSAILVVAGVLLAVGGLVWRRRRRRTQT